ncbi:MAG: hypothetical protein P0S94_03620, partial [Simkaniaceae bacterium]|nr:hypothetical protein [Simkaniaceae bacterium]
DAIFNTDLTTNIVNKWAENHQGADLNLLLPALRLVTETNIETVTRLLERQMEDGAPALPFGRLIPMMQIPGSDPAPASTMLNPLVPVLKAKRGEWNDTDPFAWCSNQRFEFTNDDLEKCVDEGIAFTTTDSFTAFCTKAEQTTHPSQKVMLYIVDKAKELNFKTTWALKQLCKTDQLPAETLESMIDQNKIEPDFDGLYAFALLAKGIKNPPSFKIASFIVQLAKTITPTNDQKDTYDKIVILYKDHLKIILQQDGYTITHETLQLWLPYFEDLKEYIIPKIASLSLEQYLEFSSDMRADMLGCIDNLLPSLENFDGDLPLKPLEIVKIITKLPKNQKISLNLFIKLATPRMSLDSETNKKKLTKLCQHIVISEETPPLSLFKGASMQSVEIVLNKFPNFTLPNDFVITDEYQNLANALGIVKINQE